MEITLKKRSITSVFSVLWLTPLKTENNTLATKLSTKIHYFKNKRIVDVLGYKDERFNNKI